MGVRLAPTRPGGHPWGSTGHDDMPPQASYHDQRDNVGSSRQGIDPWYNRYGDDAVPRERAMMSPHNNSGPQHVWTPPVTYGPYGGYGSTAVYSPPGYGGDYHGPPFAV